MVKKCLFHVSLGIQFLLDDCKTRLLLLQNINNNKLLNLQTDSNNNFNINMLQSYSQIYIVKLNKEIYKSHSYLQTKTMKMALLEHSRQYDILQCTYPELCINTERETIFSIGKVILLKYFIIKCNLAVNIKNTVK